MKTSEPFLVMAKPVGPVCNLDCGYCYYLRKEELFPRGERFRMREEVLESYVRSYIAASPGPTVHFVWHGGEPTLLGTAFYEMALAFQERHLPSGWSCMNSLQTNGSLLDERCWRHNYLVTYHPIPAALFCDGLDGVLAWARKMRGPCTRGTPSSPVVCCGGGGPRRLGSPGVGSGTTAGITGCVGPLMGYNTDDEDEPFSPQARGD